MHHLVLAPAAPPSGPPPGDVCDPLPPLFIGAPVSGVSLRDHRDGIVVTFDTWAGPQSVFASRGAS